jgi:hypothetical protein
VPGRPRRSAPFPEAFYTVPTDTLDTAKLVGTGSGDRRQSRGRVMGDRALGGSLVFQGSEPPAIARFLGISVGPPFRGLVGVIRQ